MAVNLQTKALDILSLYYPQVLAELGMVTGPPMPPVVMVSDANDPHLGGGFAAYDNGTIYVGPTWKPANIGAIIHEATHAAVSDPTAGDAADPSGKWQKDWNESLGEYMRWKLDPEQGTSGEADWTPDAQAKRLIHLAAKQPGIITVMTQALAQGTFDPALMDPGADGSYLSVARDGGTIPSVDTTTNTASGATPTNGYTQWQKEYTTTAAGAWGGEPPPTTDTGPTPQERRQKANDTAYYTSLITGMGISMGPNLNHLVEAAMVHNWNDAAFLAQLRATAAYKEAFPGIFDENGVLKMTEDQYRTEEQQYQAFAQTAGIDMSGGRMAWLFSNDVTSAEFQDRATAYTRLERDKGLYAAFGRELVQAGVATPKDVNDPKEMFRFVMGDGNKAWYDLWQDAITRNAAVQAGISFAKHASKYTTLSQGVIEHISSLGLSEAEMATKFGAVEEALRKVLPLQEADTYGVNKKTVVAAAFGGKGSSAARGRLERAQTTADAFTENRAASAVYSDDQGHTITQGVSDVRRQQSEG